MANEHTSGQPLAPDNAKASLRGASELERLDAQLDAAFDSNGLVKEVADADRQALVRLHELLRFPSVAVPSEFADRVMARLKAEASLDSAASTTKSRLIAIVGAAGLLLAIAALAGASGAGSESVLGGVFAGLASVMLAGGGLLAATWTGVGSSVGSWLGTSPTVGAFAALAFVGVALAFVGGLRRRRSGSRSN